MVKLTILMKHRYFRTAGCIGKWRYASIRSIDRSIRPPIWTSGHRYWSPFWSVVLQNVCWSAEAIWQVADLPSFWEQATANRITHVTVVGIQVVWLPCATTGTGPWFNIKMSSYQYRKSHCGDRTVVRSSYLFSGISYAGKMSSLYWIGPWSLLVVVPDL